MDTLFLIAFTFLAASLWALVFAIKFIVKETRKEAKRIQEQQQEEDRERAIFFIGKTGQNKPIPEQIYFL